MSSLPIKCAARGYAPGPFYLVQSNGNEKRYVAGFTDKDRIKLFLFAFIDGVTDEVLVRIVDGPGDDDPVGYTGPVDKALLKRMIDKHELVIFHDGMHDLMIRDAVSGDYLAFDEHGLIYLYTSRDTSGLMQGHGLQYRANGRLIHEFDHWHVSPPNAPDLLVDLVRDLALAPDRIG